MDPRETIGVTIGLHFFIFDTTDIGINLPKLLAESFRSLMVFV